MTLLSYSVDLSLMVFNQRGVASACVPVSKNEKGVASGAVGQSEGVWPLCKSVLVEV